MNNNFAKVGIVGAGYIATHAHLPVLTAMRDARITAICDTDKQKARVLADRYGIPRAYDSLNRMLTSESFDAVDILTTPNTHAELAELALENDCHVLVEKPLATRTEDADLLIRLANERKLGLHVMHNWSFLPCFRKARALIASGMLGDVVGVDIRYVTSIRYERYFEPDHWIYRLQGGVFSDIAPHLLMLLLDFLGQVEIVQVITKKTSNLPHVRADELKVIVTSKKGLGSFTLLLNTPGFLFSANIYGTSESLYIDADTNSVIRYYPLRGAHDYLSRTAKAFRALREITQRTRELSYNASRNILRRTMPEGSKYLINSFIQSIRGKGTYPVSIEKCREVVSLLEGIYSSIPSN